MDTRDFNPNDSLATLLSKTTRALSTSLQAACTRAGFDVTAEQWMILLLLWREDGRFPHQIAAIIGKDRAAVTRLIDGLEKRGLAVRIPDPDDKRQKRIFLTPTGKAYEKKLLPIGVENTRRAQSGLSSGELETCKQILRKLYRNIVQ